LLEEGKKLIVDQLVYKTGGGATNSAVSLRKLGFDTTLFCVIGDDEAGNSIREELNAYQINCSSIITTPAAHTGTSFIIPCPSGNRAVLVYRGANLCMTQQTIPYAALEKTDVVYITSLSGPTAPLLKPIAQYAKKHSCTVAANPGTSQLTAGAQHLVDALPFIDILIFNYYEASLLMQTLQPTAPFDIDVCMDTVFTYGPTPVVITNGPDGVYVDHHNTRLYHPSLKVTVVSTLGAGDAFGSCFVGQLMQGTSVDDAIRYGVINSASVLAHTDCKAGLLNQEELDIEYNKLDPQLLTTKDKK
jgi:sugar/nucleoside kinase (ribokinase family)